MVPAWTTRYYLSMQNMAQDLYLRRKVNAYYTTFNHVLTGMFL